MSHPVEIPLLPLRDVVVFPHMVVPLFVGRPKSIEALEVALKSDKKILLVTQKSAEHDEPHQDTLYQVGTLASILQLLKLPDGTVKVLVEGLERAKITSFIEEQNHYLVRATSVEETILSGFVLDAFKRSLLNQVEQYAQLSKKISSEILASLHGLEEVSRLADAITVHAPLKIEQKQSILEVSDLAARCEQVLALLESELDLLQIEKRIRGRVKKQMERNQRDYYLNEQIKAIQKELGDSDESGNELEQLKKRIEQAGLSKEALEKANAEFNKLKQMSPLSAEASVVRAYLDWLVKVPWSAKSTARVDLSKAREILDADHYGLEEVKERILEFLAVHKRVKTLKGPVLCLVGPPGVGKTSLAESIARATNRKFVRMALGGVRDEAEIRGHRRTYIGSMPGRLLQKMAKVGVTNPLFLLDEIDKLGADMRGDPASALLEVLDPEQNRTFNDHYLEVDYDLSNVMFLCTANSMNIPAPLLDRMEIIRLPGYTEDEKSNIAQRYLSTKQTQQNGLKSNEVTFEPTAIRDLIRYYTQEAGVRGLEREIAKICRKIVLTYATQKKVRVTVNSDSLEAFLGVRKFRFGLAEKEPQIGQMTGLAWTQAGGELLTIEAVVVQGKGQLVRTGSLGDVMLESMTAALTVVRSRAKSLGIAVDFYEKHDLHIHMPEGATPKDGPSAGAGMCIALISALTNIPIRADVAITGEITLRGQVLAIGGLKEKLLAAHRGGIKTVVIPQDNIKDLKEIPDSVRSALIIQPVESIDAAVKIALQHAPEPLEAVFLEHAPQPQKTKGTKTSSTVHTH